MRAPPLLHLCQTKSSCLDNPTCSSRDLNLRMGRRSPLGHGTFGGRLSGAGEPRELRGRRALARPLAVAWPVVSPATVPACASIFPVPASLLLARPGPVNRTAPLCVKLISVGAL